MSTILPPGVQPSQAQPVPAQAAPTAVIREPSVELLRLAQGTRIEGTVLPQAQGQTQGQAQGQTGAQPQTQTPSPPAPSGDAARTAVQTLQNASDAARASATQTPDPARSRADSAAPQPQNPSPQVVVRTPIGDITLRTPSPLPAGAQITFDIASTSNAQVTVRIATLNGQPIQQALAQLAADRGVTPKSQSAAQPAASARLAQPPALSFGQVWTPGGALNLTQAGPLNAFVLSSTSALTTNPGTAASLPGTPGQPGLLTGSDLTLRITSTSPAPAGATPPSGATPGVLQGGAIPTAGASPTAGAGQTSANPGAAPPNPGGAAASSQGSAQALGQVQSPGQPSGPGALLPTGGQAQQGLRLVGAQGWPPAPFTTPSQVQGTPVQLALTGTVTAQSTAAQTVLQTLAGDIQLGSRVNLPPGSTVTLEILSQSPPRAHGTTGAVAQTAPPPPTIAALPFVAGTAWPTLAEAVQLLQRTDPQTGQMLLNSLPDGGPRTVVAALSFVQAMRTGDLRQWPGDNSLRALERAGPRGAHLARALAGEVAQLGTQVRESAGEWRATPIPWNANGQIEKINLITRREDSLDEDDQDNANKGGSQGLRFLLDLELTQLGAIQLDGMYHEETKGFDMILRSHETLDDAIRRDLTGLFVAANQAVGLKGGLSFQVTRKFADPIGSSEPLKLERDGVWA